MKRHIKTILTGLIYGMLPVGLALLLIHSLGALASAVCNAMGLEAALTLQIVQALQQLQNAKIVMPWPAGLALGVAASLLLLTVKGRKGRIALTVVGTLLLLPLTLVAFCLTDINEIQVWRELLALAQWL